MQQLVRIGRQALALAVPLLLHTSASAQSAASPAPVAKAPDVDDEDTRWTDVVTFSGYLEAYYAHNFEKPANGVINNRWLDERHDSFTLQTVAHISELGGYRAYLART